MEHFQAYNRGKHPILNMELTKTEPKKIVGAVFFSFHMLSNNLK